MAVVAHVYMSRYYMIDKTQTYEYRIVGDNTFVVILLELTPSHSTINLRSKFDQIGLFELDKHRQRHRLKDNQAVARRVVASSVWQVSFVQGKRVGKRIKSNRTFELIDLKGLPLHYLTIPYNDNHINLTISASCTIIISIVRLANRSCCLTHML